MRWLCRTVLMPASLQSLRLVLLLVSPRRPGVATDRVLRIAPASLLVSVLTMPFALVFGLTGAILPEVQVRLLSLIRRLARFLTEMSAAGLDRLVATARRVLLMAGLVGVVVGYFLILRVLVARPVLLTTSLLAVVAPMGMALVMVL